MRRWFLLTSALLLCASPALVAQAPPAGAVDSGDTAFMLVSAALVMLMTPGLAFFYGGLVGRRNVLGIMIQSYVSMGWTTVLWVTVGYSLCFSGGAGGIIGNLDMAFMRWHAEGATGVGRYDVLRRT